MEGSCFGIMLFCGMRYNPWVKYALKHLPPAILSELRDKLAFFLTGNKDACRLPRAICEQKEIILLSEHILPKEDVGRDQSDKKVRYFVFVVLHEIAHAVKKHRSPLIDKLSANESKAQEKEANELALSWFNDHVRNMNNLRLKPLTYEEIEKEQAKNQEAMTKAFERV